MKKVTFILSLYVIFLACLPALGAVDILPELMCCTQDHDEQQENEESDCEDVCNPFFSCQCFHGFTAVVISHTYKPPHFILTSWIKYS
ncbi:MAG: hypothetical protein AAF824_25480, partial [Bacteroidota bacterium]